MNEPTLKTRARILIVEDAQTLAKLIEEKLLLRSHTVVGIAASGEEALAIAAESKPDLALMDIRLKGPMDGIEAARLLNDRFGIPVVYMTAFGDYPTLERATTTEPFAFLVKPFEDIELYSAIELGLHKSQLERRIRERERWYANLLRNIQEGIIATNAEGVLQFANRAALELLAMREPEVLGRNVLELFRSTTNGQRQTFQSVLTDVTLRRENVTITDFQLEREGGCAEPIEGIAVPLQATDDSTAGMVLTFRSVRERWEANERLRKLSSVVEQSVNGILIANCDQVVEYVNGAFENLTNLNKSDLIGRSLTILGSGEQTIEAIQWLGAPADGGHAHRLRIEVTDKHGKPRYAEKSVFPIRNASGTITHYVLTLKDVTDQNNAEQQLAQSYEELQKAKLCAEEQARLLELQAVDLKEAREAAEQAARLKADFMASMSHEIRTPLNAIIGASDLLRQSSLSDKQREYSEIISRSSKALLHLVNDILDFSKFEAGKIVLEHIEFDPREVVEETVALLATRAEEKGIDVGCIVGRSVRHRVRGDPGRLRQVLLNLVDNAIKFTERGYVLLQAQQTDARDGKNNIRFSVRDTGIGISQELRDKLFAPFTQLDSSTTRKYGGTGLGLSISKRIVELMGGRMGFESQPGSGTEFWLDIPFEDGSWLASPDLNASLLADIRVLILDRSAISSSIVKHYLEQEKARVDRARNPVRATRLLRQAIAGGDAYDFLLIDFATMTGARRAVVHQLSTYVSLADTKLIALKPLGKKEGIEIHTPHSTAELTRPIRFRSLVDTLIRHLESHGQPSYPEEIRPNLPPPATETHNLRILVVEDNEANRAVLGGMLRELGYAFDTVDNGRMAVQAVQERTYDIIFMDCHLPEIDGWEASWQIRRAEGEERYARIIAVTADVLSGDRERCFAAGMDDYIAKPVEFHALKTLLEKWVPIVRANPRRSVPPRRDAKAKMSTLDRRRLEELRVLEADASASVLEKAVQAYLKSAPNSLDVLRQAVEKNDASQVVSAAHALRGSSMNIGAVAVAELCGILLMKGRSQDLEGVDDVLRKLEAEYRRAELELTAELSGESQRGGWNEEVGRENTEVFKTGETV